MQQLGRNLKELVHERGTRVADLADKLGVKPATIYGWMEGGKDPSLKQLVAICTLFDVTFNFLLYNHDAPESEIYPPRRHRKAVK